MHDDSAEPDDAITMRQIAIGFVFGLLVFGALAFTAYQLATKGL